MGIDDPKMEIKVVRELLVKVALDHAGMPTDEALKHIATVMLHIAEGVNEIRQHLSLQQRYA